MNGMTGSGGGSRASCRQASCRQDVRSRPNGGRQPQRRDERSWVLRSRAHGRDLPRRQGNRRSGHRRFSRWYHAGVRERVLKALTTDRDNQDRLIDSTVRPHQQAASGKAGPGIRRRDVPEADGPPSPYTHHGEPRRPPTCREAHREGRIEPRVEPRGPLRRHFAKARPMRSAARSGPSSPPASAATSRRRTRGSSAGPAAPVPPTRPLTPMHGAPSWEPTP